KIELAHNVITTTKIDESMDFYTQHFGFELVADVGFYKHLRAGEGVEIALMEPNHPSQPPLYQPEWKGQGLILTFQVADVASAYADMKEKGVPIAFDLKREEWGQVHFGIKDPNGIPVDVVQYI
ncbi:MAG: glyoxalase, partial [Desulfobacteraceae bacterium]|nr:glyoxalase [Desulfobacteraceae bacterium]